MKELTDLFFPGQRIKKIKSLGNHEIWTVWNAEKKKTEYVVYDRSNPFFDWRTGLRTEKITKAREYLKKYAGY